MGRLSALGTFILIIGFVVYQFGLLITLHQTTLVDALAVIFPEGSSLDLIGVALGFGGGILGIVGLIICVLNATSTQHKEALRDLMKLKEAFSEALQKTIPTHRHCKFCGKEIDEGAFFCPACNRSQR